VSFGTPVSVREIGTGQGMMARYVRRRLIENEEGEKEYQDVRMCTRMLFTASEIHTLKASAQQQGANILSTLTAAWTGALLGGAYKDERLDITVPAHSYRACLIAGIQPLEAEVLTKADSLGLPQRVVWMPSQDAVAADMAEEDMPEWPGEFKVVLPVVESDPAAELVAEDGGVVEMTVCGSYRREVLASRRERMRPGYAGDPLDAHLMLCRAKVAAAFALMDGRTDIGEEDWELSGIVARLSVRVRESVLGDLEKRTRKVREVQRAEAVGIAVEAEKAKHADMVEQTARRVMRILESAGGQAVHSEVRRKVSGHRREYFAEAVDSLLASGAITVAESERGTVYSKV
jgi:hypothetical protein